MHFMLGIDFASQVYLHFRAVVQARTHTYITVPRSMILHYRATQYDSHVGDSTVLYTNYDMYHVTQKTTISTESIEY